MMEAFVLLVISLLLGVGSLGVAGWLAATGQFATVDGLFAVLVCLVLALVFFINCLWTIRSKEFREWMQSRQAASSLPISESMMSQPIEDTAHSVMPNRLVLAVWGWLLALTGIEVFLAYEKLALHIMLVLLLGLSIVKAGLIMAYFMHLRFEKASLVLTLVPALVIVISLLGIFFPDSLRLLHMRPS
jgi:cytochrome c oxidase subunit IV